MSVNKYQNGELVKVSGGPASASEVYFKDDVSGLGVTNVKAAIDKLNIKKVETGNVLNSLDAINATTDANTVAGALAVKELKNNLQTSFQAGVDSIYNAVKGKGSTPSSKTPSAIVSAINAIKTGASGTLTLVTTNSVRLIKTNGDIEGYGTFTTTTTLIFNNGTITNKTVTASGETNNWNSNGEHNHIRAEVYGYAISSVTWTPS